MELKRQYKEKFYALSLEYKNHKEKIRSDYANVNLTYQLREEFETKLKNAKENHRRKADVLYQNYEEAVQTMLQEENVSNRTTKLDVMFNCGRFNFRFNLIPNKNVTDTMYTKRLNVIEILYFTYKKRVEFVLNSNTEKKKKF